MNEQSEITIIVSVYNRPTYTRRSLKSLFRATALPILVVDDYSKEINWHKTLNLIDGNKTVSYIRMNQNYGIDKLVNLFPSFVDSQYIYIAENDVIYSSKFERKLKQLLKILEENDNFIGTVYNSFYHYEQEIYNHFFIFKESMGGLSILIRKELFEEFIKYYNSVVPKHPNWDWSFVQFAAENNLKFISSKSSYAQHIGTWGVHAKPPYVIDIGKNFIE